jgi:tetratricopeptide (TPR) repeat protein
LESLVEPLGHPPEAVDVFLFAHSLIFPEPWAEDSSPVALSSEENRTFDRAAMATGWTAGEIAARELRAELVRRRKAEKADAAKRDAERLFQGLIAATPKERIGLVEAFPDYWNWALAVRVCSASVKSAGHRADEALEWAEVALSIAERAPGEESWCSRLKSYCWAHLANARRVSNAFAEAEEGFARAWDLRRAGADSDPELLGDWVLPSMEASLRAVQRRFSEAAELLDRARNSLGGTSPASLTTLLFQKEYVYEQMGDSQSALAILAEAAPLVEALGDTRQVLALLFKTVNNLYHLERFAEAAELLPKARNLAVQQGNELDLLRVGWMAAKLAASQGRTEEAIAGLEQVSRDFTERDHPYDAALSSLDLALLWLKAERTAEVRDLSVAMSRIFAAEGIDREALAALKLFCDAARQESATVELALQVIAEIEQVRHSAPHRSKRRGRV